MSQFMLALDNGSTFALTDQTVFDHDRVIAKLRTTLASDAKHEYS